MQDVQRPMAVRNKRMSIHTLTEHSREPSQITFWRENIDVSETWL